MLSRSAEWFAQMAAQLALLLVFFSFQEASQGFGFAGFPRLVFNSRGVRPSAADDQR